MYVDYAQRYLGLLDNQLATLTRFFTTEEFNLIELLNTGYNLSQASAHYQLSTPRTRVLLHRLDRVLPALLWRNTIPDPLIVEQLQQIFPTPGVELFLFLERRVPLKEIATLRSDTDYVTNNLWDWWTGFMGALFLAAPFNPFALFYIEFLRNLYPSGNNLKLQKDYVLHYLPPGQVWYEVYTFGIDRFITLSYNRHRERNHNIFNGLEESKWLRMRELRKQPKKNQALRCALHKLDDSLTFSSAKLKTS